jgi:glyoxylate utilization-related uncharacterized protein
MDFCTILRTNKITLTLMSWTKFLAILFICAFCLQIVYFVDPGQQNLSEKEFPEIQKEKIQNSILLKKLILKKENHLKKVILFKKKDNYLNLLKNKKEMLPFVAFKDVEHPKQIQTISDKYRNINVINIIIKGEMSISNGGNNKKLKEGEVQFYSVGSTFTDPLIENYKNGEFKAIQILVKQFKTMQKSKSVIIKNSKIVNFNGGSIRLISGAISHENGRITSSIFSDNSVRVLEVKLNKNSIFTKKIKNFYNSFIYVIEGEIEVNQNKIGNGFISLLSTEGNSV